jgi:polar amino acid transport system substrate-binding protein
LRGIAVNRAKPRRSKAAVLAALALGACGLPRDPDRTAARVQDGVLRVGVSENPPWTGFAGTEPSGLEPSLVRQFAGQQHARIVWVRGAESPLLEALKRGELDLVVGGLDSRSPWAKTLGATGPYVQVAGRKHLWLAAPGENQFLLRLDRFLAAHKGDAAARLNQERGA